MLKRLERAVLRVIIRRWMKAYPHGKPNPETVDMFVDGLEAVVAVSNARPAKYASEPWLCQSSECHADHCEAHADNAECHLIGLRENWDNPPRWLTDIGQPEIAHAALRAMMCLHQRRKGL